jgi:hypothetical protein
MSSGLWNINASIEKMAATKIAESKQKLDVCLALAGWPDPRNRDMTLLPPTPKRLAIAVNIVYAGMTSETAATFLGSPN